MQPGHALRKVGVTEGQRAQHNGVGAGGAPLFSTSDLREGYLRADPGDPAAVMRAVLRARDLVGTFDKPRYITFTEDICAHSRSKIVGCRRCLDLCPPGAIAPAGDHVAIDPQICAGCGQCAAACPTGAAAYALPPTDALMRKLRAMLSAYREAGGRRSVAANRPVFVGEDDRSAWEEAEGALRTLWHRFVGEGQIPRDRPEPDRFTLENAPGQFLVGGPETVAGYIRALRERVAFDVFNMEPRWAGFTPEQVHANIRRFAEHVMPRLT